MRIYILLICLLIGAPYTVKAQFEGVYVTQVGANLSVNLIDNEIEIYQAENLYNIEDIITWNTHYKSEYVIISDSIIKIEGNNTYIRVINEDMLLVIDGILDVLQPKTILYCTRKLYDDGSIRYFGSWENGQKHGNWLYIDEMGLATKVVYNNGKEVDRFFMGNFEEDILNFDD